MRIDEPIVSVILPVYNGERTIEATIQSLLDQTFKSFELVVCIDGTNDASEFIVNSFGDYRIRTIRNEKNLGLGRTLNRLVSQLHPSTKYIAIAEQDDYYYPYRLQKQVEHLEKNENCVLVSGIAEHFDGETVKSTFPGLLVRGDNYPSDKIENFLLNYCDQIKVVNSCMMIRKSFHLNNGLYFSMHYPSISVDWSYVLRVSLLGKIDGLNIPLVRLDRRAIRSSLTMNKDKQFSAAREVLRAFRFENSNYVTQSVYRNALTTQHLLEISSSTRLKAAYSFVKYFSQNPFDSRWLALIKKKTMHNSFISKLTDRLKLFLSKQRLNKFMRSNDIDNIISATRLYEGYGVYSRISMSQKKLEIEQLANEVKNLNPKIVVEIGTRKGGTLFVWCRYTSAETIISIDLPNGIHGGGYPEAKKKLYKHFLSDAKNRTLHLLQCDSHDLSTIEKLKELLEGRPIDFLFIDGDHTYNGVKSDFINYGELVRPGGIIAFHDIVENLTDHEDAQTIEVPKFWKELKMKYPYKELIQSKGQVNMGIGLVYK